MVTLRFALLLLLFLLLTGAGIAWAVDRSGAGRAELEALGRLPAGAVGLLALLCLAVYVADAHRYRAFGAALGTPVAWRVGLEATVANFLFSWVTPGAALGAPAAIYTLGRRGIPWDAATLIAFGKSMTGTALLLAAAFVLLATGLGPDLPPGWTLLLVWGSGVVAAILALPVAASFRPGPVLAGAARIEGGLARLPLLRSGRPRRALAGAGAAFASAVDRLGRFRGTGWRGAVAIAVSHLFYFGSFAGVGVVLATAFGAGSVARSAGVSIVYLAFTYVAPTPGGSGLSEATATAFYGGDLLADRDAVVVTLAFRSMTLYLQIGIGVVWLLAVGGLGEIVARRKVR